MTTDKALNRIFWRFGGNGNKHPFKVNETDLEAFNSLNKYVEETQKTIVEHNQLFAKLYVYMVMKIMEQKRSTVFDNIARKQIGNILKMPLSQIIEMLTDSMNDSELYGRMDEIKIKDSLFPEGAKHINLDYVEQLLLDKYTPEETAIKMVAYRNERDEQHRRFAELFENEPDVVLGEVWEYEEVKDNIIAEINLMIELHG